MRRNRVAMLGLSMLLALSTVSVLTSMAHRDASDALRARFQQQADAAFDPGVDAFTGNTIYLEGHRQNSANFGDVRQSSLLVRFGQLTPAFVLQSLAPLMLIFLGFDAIAGERQLGTLKQLFAHGARARSVLAGKALSFATSGTKALR